MGIDKDRLVNGKERRKHEKGRGYGAFQEREYPFLRYVFGIQPLFLVLMPDVSSACNKTAIQRNYLFVLSHHLELLVRESECLDGECGQNNTEELNCTTTKKIHSMACQLNNLSTCAISTDLKDHMKRVYNHTFSLIKACIKDKQKRCPQKTDPCQRSNSTVLRRIKKTISKFKSCWLQYLRS
uniref:interleukin-7-like n=1 Tax=Euleptes europaea TaxID=460621 RepID=UPI0025418643|nr:interleukin-7-like [Euleptes europaea]